MKNDATSPEHYKTGGLEVITILRKKLSNEEFRGFCVGNILKYVLRHRHKNGIEDLEKAQVYLKFLIEAETKEAKQYAAFLEQHQKEEEDDHR